MMTLTRSEVRTFAVVLDKLVAMKSSSRRRNPCWRYMRSTLEHLGNWKRRQGAVSYKRGSRYGIK
jgi:hypothetical protein